MTCFDHRESKKIRTLVFGKNIKTLIILAKNICEDLPLFFISSLKIKNNLTSRYICKVHFSNISNSRKFGIWPHFDVKTQSLTGRDKFDFLKSTWAQKQSSLFSAIHSTKIFSVYILVHGFGLMKTF